MNTINSTFPTELEITLVIFSDKPLAIVGKIANMKTILDYQLVPQPTRNIHDWYWDTKDMSLFKKKLSLRIREVNANQFITMKGDARVTEWGGVERLEIEYSWSKKNLLSIMEAIKKRDIPVNTPPDNLDYDRPIDVLERMDFKIVQDRKTERQIRNLVSHNQEAVFAELAIDHVTYRFGTHFFHHFELEIESKHKEGITVLPAAVAHIKAFYGQVLVDWKHSKLSTGFALKRLIERESVANVITGDNHISPAAYKKMAVYLKDKEI